MPRTRINYSLEDEDNVEYEYTVSYAKTLKQNFDKNKVNVNPGVIEIFDLILYQIVKLITLATLLKKNKQKYVAIDYDDVRDVIYELHPKLIDNKYEDMYDCPKKFSSTFSVRTTKHIVDKVNTKNIRHTFRQRASIDPEIVHHIMNTTFKLEPKAYRVIACYLDVFFENTFETLKGKPNVTPHDVIKAAYFPDSPLPKFFKRCIVQEGVVTKR